MSTAETIIVWLIAFDLLALAVIFRIAAKATTMEEPRTYRSRRAMPDGSSAVEANNDAAQTLPDSSATRRDTPTGRGGPNP
jgi:hypothetical protein